MPRMPSQYFKKSSQSCVIASASTEIKLRLLAENLHKQLQNNIVFKDDLRVSHALGDFEIGESIQGLSYQQIFTKLLGLKLYGDIDVPDNPDDNPDEPGILPELPENPTVEQIVESITTVQTTIHQINADGELEEIPYMDKTFTEASYAQAPEQAETTFFRVLDTNGNTVEAGYQHITEMKEMYYMVALPDYMRLGQNTKVQTWDDLSQCWTDSQAQLTQLPDDISSAFESAGLAAPVVPEGYTLWADLNDIDAGTIYRFILI